MCVFVRRSSWRSIRKRSSTWCFAGRAASASTITSRRFTQNTPKLPDAKRDLTQAKKLLAEAGHASGLEVEIACKNHPAWEQAAVTVMAEMWKEAGIIAKINVMPAASYWSIWTKVAVRLYFVDTSSAWRNDL